MIVRTIIHVLPSVKVPLWDSCLSRVGDRLLDLSDIIFSQKANTQIRIDVERLSQYLSKIIAHTFNFTKGNYQFLTALNVFTSDSENVLIF